MNSQQVMAQLQGQYGTADWTKWNPYWQPFYDKVTYPGAGTTQLDFFAVPAGNNDPNGVQKTSEDTNCIVPRQLGQNYLWIWEVRCGIFIKPKARQPSGINSDANYIFGSSVGMESALWALFNRGVLTISVDSKQYLVLDRPFKRAPFGAGLNFVNMAAAAAAGPAVQSVAWIQNNPDEANVFAETPPLWVAPTQTISVQLVYPDGTGPVFTNLVDSATPSIQVGVFLGGYMVRASQ